MPPDSNDSHEEEPLEAVMPGFGPSRRSTLDPLDPERTTVTGPPAASSPTPSWPPVYDPNRPLADQLDDHDELEDEFLEPIDPRNPSSSSRASTREPDPVVSSALEQLANLAVTFGSLALNRTIGRGGDAWVIHDDEAAAISRPLGRIGARHAPVGDGVAGDVADGMEAGLAAAGYAMRATADQAKAHTVETPVQPGGEQ